MKETRLFKLHENESPPLPSPYRTQNTSEHVTISISILVNDSNESVPEKVTRRVQERAGRLSGGQYIIDPDLDKRRFQIRKRASWSVLTCERSNITPRDREFGWREDVWE